MCSTPLSLVDDALPIRIALQRKSMLACTSVQEVVVCASKSHVRGMIAGELSGNE